MKLALPLLTLAALGLVKSQECSDVCPTEQPDGQSLACDMEALRDCDCEYSDNSECFFSCIEGNWQMACFGDDSPMIPPAFDTAPECKDICPANEPNQENNAVCDSNVQAVCDCVYSDPYCFYSCMNDRWVMACASPDTGFPPMESPVCEDVCPAEQPDWENDAACDMEALRDCDCKYSDNSECFFNCMEGKWQMACFGDGDETLPIREFETSPECKDICPADEPDWENNAACDTNLQGDCDCVYDEPTCFVSCSGDVWSLACARGEGGIPPVEPTTVTSPDTISPTVSPVPISTDDKPKGGEDDKEDAPSGGTVLLDTRHAFYVTAAVAVFGATLL